MRRPAIFEEQLSMSKYFNKIIQYIITRIYWWYNKNTFIKLGAAIGLNPKISGHIKLVFDKSCIVKIGKNFSLNSGNFYNPLSRNIKSSIILLPRSTLIIGDNVGISSSCLWVHSKVIIKNNVNVGADCIILDSNCHSLNYINRRTAETDLMDRIDTPIIIENDVLIGTRSIVLKGVTIGARSIIAAGSIVTKSIPSDCIAGGNPCKVITFIKQSITNDCKE